MLKVLLVCDRKNWAYDSISRALQKYNTDKSLLLSLFYLKGNESHLKALSTKYDVFFFLGWQLILEESKNILFRRKSFQKKYRFIDDERILTGVHSHHAWDKGLSTPERDVVPPQELVSALSHFKGVNAVSQRLEKLFVRAGLKDCRYTPNGVDDSLFKNKELLAKNKDFITIGFSGNKKHD